MIDLPLDAHPDRDALLKQVAGLGEKRRSRILDAAMRSHLRAEAREPFCAELTKLQRYLRTHEEKVILLFEGRDAAGKGGAISGVTRSMDETHYRVVALGKPTRNLSMAAHMTRYVEQFPRAGEIVLFDRSWYNRAMVEPVMGFCTPEQHQHFMDTVGSHEESMVADGKTTLIKMYFSVSRTEQSKRFSRRGSDAWRLSDVDKQAQERWDSYTEKKGELLRRTHTSGSPWWVIRSNNKKQARLETMKLILRQFPYPGRSRSLTFAPDPHVCIAGDAEYRRMMSLSLA